VVRRQEAGRPEFFGAKVEVVSTTRTASFADLDLTTQAGVDEFRRRIMYSVLAACDQMEADYPSSTYIPVPPSQNCPDDTARSALSEANTVIAAARSHAR
jgi:UrcA family protein